MGDLTPEEQKELWKFMGAMDSLPNDIESLKDDVKTMSEDVQAMKLEFANLKGKLVVVAGVVTFSLNAIWGVIKGALS